MFDTQQFLQGQSYDLKDELILANPIRNAFSSFALSKSVKANNPVVSWIEETVEDSAVTMPEGGDAPEQQNDSRELLSNYLELFGATAMVSNTAQASEVVGINDLLAKDVKMKTEAIKRRIENKMLYGTKNYANGTYEMDGIFNLVHTDNRVTDASGIAPALLDETISKVYDAGLGYNLVAFCNAHMKHNINQFANVTYLGRDKMLGMDINVYSTAFGDITFIDVPAMNREDLLILNPEYIETPVLIDYHATLQGENGSKKSVYLETQLGLKLLNSKAAATFRVQ